VNFNRERFAELLRLAKGDRSINRFGETAGVDPGYISRLLRCLVPNAPSALVINRLAEAAQNHINVVDLMCAVGYLTPSSGESYACDPSKPYRLQDWEQVIEEAARYNLTPEITADLIRSLGQSLEKINK